MLTQKPVESLAIASSKTAAVAAFERADNDSSFIFSTFA